MTITSESAWLNALPKKGRVLIVDDDEMVVSVLSKFCQHIGLSVDQCFDANCAIEFYEKRSPYDAILIDIRLGPVGGDEVFKKIRQTDHDTPIAIVSGYLTDDVVNNLMQCGMVTFIKKPVDFNSPHLRGFFKSIGITE